MKGKQKTKNPYFNKKKAEAWLLGYNGFKLNNKDLMSIYSEGLISGESDRKLIPKGDYCYSYDESGKYKRCPYWSANRSPYAGITGACGFISENDQTLGCGLLHDQCKECGVNNEISEDDIS
jgi:hypothetical protein